MPTPDAFGSTQSDSMLLRGLPSFGSRERMVLGRSLCLGPRVGFYLFPRMPWLRRNGLERRVVGFVKDGVIIAPIL